MENEGVQTMKLGVVGGLGPLASAYFYELITKMTDSNNDQGHLEIIIHSCPTIPDRTKYILDKNNPTPVNKLVEVIADLNVFSVDYIAIPCVTAHYFYEELQLKSKMPIINIIDETLKYLNQNSISRVGILATSGTICSNILQKSLELSAIEYCIPNLNNQEKLMHIIYNNVKKGEKINEKLFYEVANDLLNQGVEIIILGCTELSIVKKELELDNQFLDLLELLAYTSLNRCGIKCKKWR